MSQDERPGRPARLKTCLREHYLGFGKIFARSTWLIAAVAALTVFSMSAIAQTSGRLSILTYNPGGIDPQEGQSWEVRSSRLVDWMVFHQKLPDVIAFQQIDGWRWAPPLRACGRGFGEGLSDYEQADILMRQLRDRIGVTYRIAYLTGRQRSFGTIPCQQYIAQALFYNPARLANLMAGAPLSGTRAHDDNDVLLDGVPHLRRSLPLCNRGGNAVMPLETLIDGLPQTDKCGRGTPSGVVWSVIKQEGHIAATLARLAFKDDPNSVIDIFNVNPTAGYEEQDLEAILRLMRTVPQPQTMGVPRYYPPFLVGDFNSTVMENYPNYSLVEQTGPEDYIRVGRGSPAAFPARFQVDLAVAAVLPDLPNGFKCYGPPNLLISDHCAIFVQFERSATDQLQAVRIDGPNAVISGKPYHLNALVTGGGSHALRYQWQPQGANAAVIDLVAGPPGTEVWRLVVTDTSDGRTATAPEYKVNVLKDPEPCLDACAADQESCLQIRPPQPRICAQQRANCNAKCGPLAR